MAAVTYNSWLGGLSKDPVAEILGFLDRRSLARVRQVCKQAMVDASVDALWLTQLGKMPSRLWSIGPGVTPLQAFSRTANSLTSFHACRYEIARFHVPYVDIAQRHMIKSEKIYPSEMEICGDRFLFRLSSANYGSVLSVDHKTKDEQLLTLSHPMGGAEGRPLALASGEQKVFAMYTAGDQGVIDVWDASSLGVASGADLPPTHTIVMEGYFPSRRSLIDQGNLFVCLKPIDWDSEDPLKRAQKICCWDLQSLQQTSFSHEDIFDDCMMIVRRKQLGIVKFDYSNPARTWDNPEVRAEEIEYCNWQTGAVEETVTQRFEDSDKAIHSGRWVVRQSTVGFSAITGNERCYIDSGRDFLDNNWQGFEVFGSYVLGLLGQSQKLESSPTHHKVKLGQVYLSAKPVEPHWIDRCIFPHTWDEVFVETPVSQLRVVNGDVWLLGEQGAHRLNFKRVCAAPGVCPPGVPNGKFAVLESLLPEMFAPQLAHHPSPSSNARPPAT